MKKKLLFLIMLCCSLNIWAAKSAGTPMLVLQPDGKSVTIQLLGDEDFSWYQTTDGVLLVRNGSAYYVASVNKGELVSTGVLAHDASDRSTKETNLIKAQDKDSFFVEADNSVIKRKKAVDKLDKNIFCPHMGEIHIPIILMNYTDKKFVLGNGDKEKLYEVFEEYFNGTTRTPYSDETKYLGYSSVRQYFIDASNGKFTPVFDLYGPYETINNHDYYGKAKGNTNDLLTEAVACADADIDFSQYDSNNDGYVDLVYVLYAGTGANLSGNRNDAWPACWGDRAIRTRDNKIVNVIGVTNELAADASIYVKEPIRAGIGVFCHEMSHGLGLPDLYWTLKTEPMDINGNVDYDNCGPEDWDIMDGGENIFNGMWPCQYTTWEREYLGWEDAEEITEAQNITLVPRNKGGKAYRITNPADPYEYYTIEHSGYDGWNYYLNKKYGNGMLIMHITSSPDGFSMTPNNTYGHPNITLLPADGNISSRRSNDFTQSLKGDIYPGLQEVTSVESFKNYSGSDMAKSFPITNIVKNEDQTVSFRFMGGEYHIEDGEPLADVPTGQYGKITYTRNFTNVNWQAIYLPFSLNYEDLKDDFELAYINTVRQNDNDEDGVIDETVMEIIKMKSGSTQPNIPYLIRAKTAGEKTISAENTTIYAAESGSVDCSTTIAKFTITGTYNEIPSETMIANDYYGMGGGKLIKSDGSNGLKPFRWYMKVESRDYSKYSVNNAAKSITIKVLDEEETTGIANIQHPSPNTQIFDINGRKVNENSLKPGIYVKNGKKFVK